MDSSDHWSEYWSRGCLTSLPEDFAANYDGEIAEFWRNAFQSVPAGGSVIDLCTGNGAIALLAAEYATREEQDLSITAVDGATVNSASSATAGSKIWICPMRNSTWRPASMASSIANGSRPSARSAAF